MKEAVVALICVIIPHAVISLLSVFILLWRSGVVVAHLTTQTGCSVSSVADVHYGGALVSKRLASCYHHSHDGSWNLQKTGFIQTVHK